MSTLALVPREGEQLAGELTPLERILHLCDPGSVNVFRSEVAGGGRRSEPGDGVVAAAGTRGGQPVFAYAQDSRFVGGSLGAAHGESIVRVLRMARAARAPVVGFVESAGARVDEGVAALAGYGRIFREQVLMSGECPQIAVVTGVSAGGGAYSPALADFVVMTGESRLFLTGPGVVREVMGEDVGMEALGGPAVHSRNGVAHLEARDDVDAVNLAGDLLDHLPPHSSEPFLPAAAQDPPVTDIGAIVPLVARKVYDVRDVIAGLADGPDTIEIAPRFARNVVTSHRAHRRPARSASSPTSRTISAACSTRRAPRRRRDSYVPATHSDWRWWCWWTPRGSSRGSARNATACFATGPRCCTRSPPRRSRGSRWSCARRSAAATSP